MRALSCVCPLLFAACSCSSLIPALDHPNEPFEQNCHRVEEGYGPDGQVPLHVEVLADGLEVPWGIAFLPDGDALITERPGRLRLLRDGALVPQPVLELDVVQRAEDGLLGVAIHPRFSENRRFYLYFTRTEGDATTNVMQAFQLAEDGRSAQPQEVVFSGIAAAFVHDGGRIHFGPDGMLYVSTGDARKPDRSQDVRDPAGKILRLTPDGAIPEDNPWPGSPAWIAGIRNSQGFGWLDDETMVVIDHGPSGERMRQGNDEVSVARKGANLGWPEIFGCESREGLQAPAISWREANPPAGMAIYRGDRIPDFRGDVLVATLRSQHLQRIRLGADGKVIGNEVYLRGTWGRLREVVQAPDGSLWITTSNCDGRGNCGPEKDRILRVTQRG